MAQWVKVLSTKPTNLSSLPESHTIERQNLVPTAVLHQHPTHCKIKQKRGHYSDSVAFLF